MKPNLDATYSSDLSDKSDAYSCGVSASGKSKGASWVGFSLAVLACLLAAGTVASHDVPLMLGGL